MEEIYESEARTAGDVAGIFEFDGDVSYFYLYSSGADGAQKIIGTLRIGAGDPDFEATDLSIRWDEKEEFVGLFVKNKLRAAFDAAGNAYGPVTTDPMKTFPKEIRERFGVS